MSAGLVTRIYDAVMWVFREMGRQEDRHVLWAPVMFIAGIGGYFALPVEPALPVFWVAAALSVFSLAMKLRARGSLVLLMSGMIAAGFVTAKVRTASLSTPVLAATTGTVQIIGWIGKMEMTSAKRARYYIHLENASGIKRDAIPRLIRITGKKPPRYLIHGDRITARARLTPLPTPAYPSGFDFARRLWFEGIGATGFILGDITITGRRDTGVFGSVKQYVQTLRQTMAVYIAAALPGKSGSIAIALITGQRGFIDKETRTALQTAGLAHILAISGFHMTLVAGGVFWLVRALLALSPIFVLNYPIKKWAAIAGLLAGLFYLVISGAGVATQRAFIMISIMFLAILVNRPAISMRNVAIAAMIISVFRPESVLGAGFQMSFLAVAGLVGFHEMFWNWRRKRDRKQKSHLTRIALKPVGFFLALAFTTLIASIYTGLPAAFHFNRIAVYSLAGNLLALPLFSLFVMPMAILSVVLMPLGLEALPLEAMGWGIDQVVAHAERVAGWPNASLPVAAMKTAPVVAIAAGLIWIVLWRGRLRLAGTVIAGVATALALPDKRPDILFSKFGRNAAFVNANGELVPADNRKSRFAVENWLTKNGDKVSIAQAAKRTGWTCNNHLCVAVTKGVRIAYVTRKFDLKKNTCDGYDIMLAEVPLRRKCQGRLLTVDRFDLWRNGAYAIRFVGDRAEKRPIATTAAQLRGKRPWVGEPVSRKSIRLPKNSAPAPI